MDDFARKLGKNIKMMRVFKDKSQAELSFDSGLNQSYLSRVEKGTVNVTVIKLCCIAKALGCNLAELVPEVNGTSIP
ncbi:MAG: transcriptional regulator [Pseudoalteromonas sp.]|uniref:helix-turn-helix domain-containing protein n=1 Tax=Pseudoalteromonas sp. TaxID=53249 RepID=UPI000C98E236|nr:helix-turn-helix transcriptional regulator [Pseudoalteromonas sp.]MAD03409.1 transcriptional regulator [Pseudoalteromonas sp.]|tara:strand:+ start:14434 stop:14664 length:231 start_codon:yes stop_codon:yes gene_type:complete